jgi:histidyl-tRNA synthetase
MKPSLPQGTRDFSAIVVKKRQFILNTIQKRFELYGYQPLETPAMENLTTLTGKYGEEGDRLIFKILNNGLNESSKLEKTTLAFQHILNGKSDVNITERALRYDLTIPFARYVAMNRNDINLPFKRYQMQPVWRADRPQKGRYREFWQCDADIVGSDSLLNESELLNIYWEVFQQLKVPEISIKLNNRKILSALSESINKKEKLNDITIAIDKLDKIGESGVTNELTAKGFTEDNVKNIFIYLNITGNNEQKLEKIEALLSNTIDGPKGIVEIKSILQYLKVLNPNCNVELDFSLARGLDYYTGMIVEVKTNAVSIGSIGGGGRYDNLTGVFDYPNVSGVGISFGVDRIYDVLEALQLFPNSLNESVPYFFVNFGGAMETKAIACMQHLRGKNIGCEIFPEATKFDKQMKYANKRNYPFVVIIGEDELANDELTLKNFVTGAQEKININTWLEKL